MNITKPVLLLCVSFAAALVLILFVFPPNDADMSLSDLNSKLFHDTDESGNNDDKMNQGEKNSADSMLADSVKQRNGKTSDTALSTEQEKELLTVRENELQISQVDELLIGQEAEQSAVSRGDRFREEDRNDEPGQSKEKEQQQLNPPQESRPQSQPEGETKTEPTAESKSQPAAATEAPKTNEELDLLARLITAEAQGEPYEAQVGVGAVVINRVQSGIWADSIEGVIYQNINGYYQFAPVENGWINKPAKPEAIKAAKAALNGADPTNGAQFYYDDKATNQWILAKPVSMKTGHMIFAF